MYHTSFAYLLKNWKYVHIRSRILSQSSIKIVKVLHVLFLALVSNSKATWVCDMIRQFYDKLYMYRYHIFKYKIDNTVADLLQGDEIASWLQPPSPIK